MKYVRCVNNKQYIRFKDEPFHNEEISDLVVGQIYRLAAPDPNDGTDDIRVIDESGEDYLFPASYFEPVLLTAESFDEASATITIHLSPVMKGILHAEALSSQKSVSALLREWIDERLDLPIVA